MPGKTPFSWESVDWSDLAEAKRIAENVPLKELEEHLHTAHRAVEAAGNAILASQLYLESGQVPEKEAKSIIEKSNSGVDGSLEIMRRVQLLTDAHVARQERVKAKTIKDAQNNDFFSLHEQVKGFEHQFLSSDEEVPELEEHIMQKAIHKILMRRLTMDFPPDLGTSDPKRLSEMEASLAGDIKALKAIPLNKMTDDPLELHKFEMRKHVLMRTELLHAHVKKRVLK